MSAREIAHKRLRDAMWPVLSSTSARVPRGHRGVRPRSNSDHFGADDAWVFFRKGREIFAGRSL